MGFIGNLITSVGSSKIGQTIFRPGGVVDTLTKPIQYFGAVVANPVLSITQGPSAAMQKAQTSSFESQAGKVLLNTGTVAAAVLTGGTSVGRTAAIQIGKSLIPTTAKGSLTTAVVVTAGAGVLSTTKKPLEAVTKAPGALFNFGSNVGGLIEDPNLRSAEKLLKENPLITGVALAGTGLLVGKTLLPAVSSYLQGEKIEQAIKDIPVAGGSGVIAQTQATPQEIQKPFSPITAITPATQQVSSVKTGLKRTKRKPKQIPTSINQKVNVIVSNKNTSVGTKNYLNKRLLYN